MYNDFGRQGSEIDPVKTGKRIQELRKARGLRVTDISDYMGFFDPQAVYKWLRGESLPTLRNMHQLSQLFGTTIDDIIRCAEAAPEAERAVSINTRARGEDERTSPRSVLPKRIFQKKEETKPAVHFLCLHYVI